MFTRLQHSLNSASGQNIPLPTYIHDKLHTWRQLLYVLDSWPTHFRKLLPRPPTCSGATDASGTGKGSVCHKPTGRWFFWKAALPLTNQACLVSFETPKGNISINNPELWAYLDQIALFYP